MPTAGPASCRPGRRRRWRTAFDDSRAPDERPADLLLRAVEHLATSEAWSFPLDHELTRIRARLIADVPVLRAGALLRNSALRQRLTAALRRTCPDLDPLHAAALTGALVGAVDAALESIAADADQPGAISSTVIEAARFGLQGHLSHSESETVGQGVRRTP
ncbi:hypothetical protein [Nocardia sp. NPDC050793]|uniref:acyl-CoA-like ligand-binding transcription factor n=1 Tax=Nocardia sp. NPDC050793 TaxID=3155159 RepID=UPI00340D1558